MSKSTDNKATDLMEEFIENGYYPLWKQTESKIKLLSAALKQKLKDREEKRIEYSRFNMVGRFVSKRIYETNYIELNEYLYDLGLLLHVIEMDNKILKENFLISDLVEPFKLSPSFYIRPSFNKAGKSLNQLSNSFTVDDRWSEEDIVRSLAIMKPQLKELERKYDKLKAKILKTKEIQELRKEEVRKPMQFKYGSISLLTHPPKYDVCKIYEQYGEGVLIEYGLPNGKLLENCILNGQIKKSEIDQFKTLKDIRLDFVVMSLDDEKAMFEMLDYKQQITASNRRWA